MKSSIRLFNIAGIEIGIHYSWLIIFILVAASLALGFFPQSYPGWTTATYWITGIIASLLLFVSVLLHELAHSFVAKARGMPVSSITLFIFGGVSNLREEPKQPWHEFTMAFAGPLTSLVLAGIFWVVLISLYAGQNNPVAATLFYLAFINALLAAFNLLPAFPLDGGRVFRSIIWGATHNLQTATNVASWTGQVFGWLLIAFGVFQVFGGNLIGGLWIAFIGWFLSSAASSARQEMTLREKLSGVHVKDVMYVNPETITPDTPVSQVVEDIFRGRHRRAVPVCKDGRTIGIVTITDVRELPRDRWDTTPVSQIMTREPLWSVSPDDDLNKAMQAIAEHDVNQVLVTNDGRCAGLVGRSDIIKYLQSGKQTGLPTDLD